MTQGCGKKRKKFNRLKFVGQNRDKPVWQLLNDADGFDHMPGKEIFLDFSDEQSDRWILFKQVADRVKSEISDEHWEIFRQTIIEGRNSAEVAAVRNNVK